MLALNWLLLSEGHREFSINAAALTLEGFVLALIVWREARASRVMAVRMAAAIVVGTTVSIGLGLLEVGGGVSLQPLRREDAGSVVLRAGTLQSVAGNPGWFSQYLVYALPYALVLLAGSSATRLRLAALTILTGVTAFALLITFQRGGWVAGTIVLFYLAIVTPGVLARDVDAGPAGRRRPWRGALYATAVILVVSALFSVWVARRNPAGEAFDRSAYLARLKSIASGDRLPYAFAGLRIASLHPVLGAGHESFAYRYGIYFDRPGGPFYRSGIRVPDPASAHDVYLQTWAGTGTVGLELLLSIFVTAAVTAIRARRAPGVGRVQLVVVTAAFGSLLGMACYGLVQEIFYVHALRLLFFVAVALIAAAGGDLVRWPPRVGFLLWTTLAATFAGHLVYEYISPGPDRLLQSGEPTGLYAEAPGVQGHALERRPGHVAGACQRVQIRLAGPIVCAIPAGGGDAIVRWHAHDRGAHRPRLARSGGRAPGLRLRRPSAHAGDADMVGPWRRAHTWGRHCQRPAGVTSLALVECMVDSYRGRSDGTARKRAPRLKLVTIEIVDTLH